MLTFRFGMVKSVIFVEWDLMNGMKSLFSVKSRSLERVNTL